MQIAILGTGQVGQAIAQGLAGGGHTITFGTRTPASAPLGARAADPAVAAQDAEIVILALPWRVAETVVSSLGDLRGKIVIDCMNPLAVVDGALALTLGHGTSAGEVVQAWLPAARVVKTLNQVGAEVMADTGGLPARPVMFMAGNDPAAKQTVGLVLARLGFDPLDAGDITKARLLEPFGMLWINQAIARGKGRAWAFATVERNSHDRQAR